MKDRDETTDQRDDPLALVTRPGAELAAGARGDGLTQWVGEAGAMRTLEFLAADICNPHTRRASLNERCLFQPQSGGR